ncbi:MAG: thioredoxin family protein [Burkholderiales bacterium]|nr:thioredoxin family protein [Burkholderiales bacterium]
MLRRTVIALPALAFATAAPAAPSVGQAAPDFTLTDATGKPVKLGDFRGKYVVLEWTNPGCPYVRKHYDSGNMAATQQDALAKGAVWLSINSTDKGHWDYLQPAKLVAWVKERRATFTAMLMDEEGIAGRAYGARTTPHMYIVDPQGKLAYAGGIDSIPSSSADDIKRATNYVKQAMGEVASGKPISAATTRPYGCSIKYKNSA